MIYILIISLIFNFIQLMAFIDLRKDKTYWFNQFLDEHNFNQRIRKILNDKEY